MTTHGRLNWQEVVQDFSKRVLTKPTDRLPAISGVASEFSLELQEPYLAGHWLKSIPGSLMWYRKPTTGRRERPATYRAPSWSWASVDGEVRFYYTNTHNDSLGIIKRHEIYQSGSNHFGEVKSGWIELSAPLVPIRQHGEIYLCEVSIANQLYTLTKDTLDLDTDEVPNKPLFALFIQQDIRGVGSGHWIKGLVIVRSETHPGAFERVGAFQLETKDERLYLDISDHELTLVRLVPPPLTPKAHPCPQQPPPS